MYKITGEFKQLSPFQVSFHTFLELWILKKKTKKQKKTENLLQAAIFHNKTWCWQFSFSQKFMSLGGQM